MFGYTTLIVDLVLLMYTLSGVHSSHFRGGIIMVRPQQGVGIASKQMEISYHISWRRDDSSSGGNCDSMTVASGNLIGGGNLICQGGCSGTITSLTYICTDFSIEENWAFGENRLTYNFEAATNIIVTLRFSSCCWISPFNDRWYLSTTFSLATRNDTGKINSSPRAITAPVIRLQEGCNHTIPIAVSDPDDDVIRCRWAVSGECASICNQFPGAELDPATCTIQYEANRGARLWAVAIMIEDFNSGSTQPLSSVGLQFLISVVASSESCSLAPHFIPPTLSQGSCVSIPPETTFTTQLTAFSGGSLVTIVEIQTVSPLGTRKGEVFQIPDSNDYYVNITWTPSINQRNETHLFCFTAVNSRGLSSEQTCVRLLPGYFAPSPIQTTATPNKGLVHPSGTTWCVRFNRNISRPSTTSYITFHRSISDEVVYRIDTSSSQEVTYETPDKILIIPQYEFAEKESYYINFDREIVQGLEECGFGNEPLTSKHFWTFETMDLTPPTITLLNSPSVSDSNVTISWEANENVSWKCNLTKESIKSTVDCSGATWKGYNLDEGIYHLEVNAVDDAGHPASITHTFVIDSTPPTTTIVQTPKVISNKHTFTFIFSCDELCLFECQLLSVFPYYNNDRVQEISRQCNQGEFTTPTLLHNVSYTFSVAAIDQAGNKGKQIPYTWHTDFDDPRIGGIRNTSTFCNSTDPEYTGQAQAHDDTSNVVSLTFNDIALECSIERHWIATDEAGNTADIIQSIVYTFSPTLSLSPNVAFRCDNASNLIEIPPDIAYAPNPCELPLQLTYTDSVSDPKCPDDFVRNWTVLSCGKSISRSQRIVLYDLCPPHACGRNESIPRGICSFGECQCNELWRGEDCDSPIYKPVITPMANSTLHEAQAYKTSLTLLQGTPPLTWTLLSGPPMLVVDQYDGMVIWNRAQTGNHTISVQVENRVGREVISWRIEVLPGYTTLLNSVSSAVFPQVQPIVLTGYVEYTVNQSISGIVPVNIDITNNGFTRTITTFTYENGTFSHTHYPIITEYGTFTAGSRHPGISVAATGISWDILGMKAIPDTIFLRQDFNNKELTFDNATYICNDGPRTLNGLTATPLLVNAENVNISVELKLEGSPSNSTLEPGDKVVMHIKLTITRPLNGLFYIVLNTTQGTTLQLGVYLQIEPTLPSFIIDPPSLNASIIRGRQKVFEFYVTNIGRAPANNVYPVLPDTDLISFISFGESQDGEMSLDHEQSAILSILTQTPANQQFGEITASIIITSNELSVRIPINLLVSSDILMNLTIVVEDEYTYFASGQPLVTNAAVTLINSQHGIRITQSTEEDNGTTTFTNIFEDHYEVIVESPRHQTYHLVIISSAEDPRVTVFIKRVTVIYIWKVILTEFQDKINLILEADFETHVPIPIVTATPLEVDCEELELGLVTSFQLNITNHGLIRAEFLEIHLPGDHMHPFLDFRTKMSELGHLEALSSILVPVQVHQKSVEKQSAVVRKTIYYINIVYSYVCGERVFRTIQVVLKKKTVNKDMIPILVEDIEHRGIVNASTFSELLQSTVGGVGEPSTPGSSSRSVSRDNVSRRVPYGRFGYGGPGGGGFVVGGVGGGGGGGGFGFGLGGGGGGGFGFGLGGGGGGGFGGYGGYGGGILGDYFFNGYEATTPVFCDKCIQSLLTCMPIPKFPPSGCIPELLYSSTNSILEVLNMLVSCEFKSWTPKNTGTSSSEQYCEINSLPTGTTFKGLGYLKKSVVGCFCDVYSNCLSLLDSSESNREKRTLRTSVIDLIESMYPIHLSIALGVEVLGDESWIAVSDSMWLSNILLPSLDDMSEAGILISDMELSNIVAQSPPNGATELEMTRMVERLNNTLYGWNNGRLEPQEGFKYNIASFQTVQDLTKTIKLYSESSKDKGFTSYIDAYNFISSQINLIDRWEDEAGVCAVVRIRIVQELTLTREAFLAKLEIENQEDAHLEQIEVEIIISHSGTREQSAHLFAIGNGTLSGSLTDTNHNGWLLPSKMSGAAEWLIIPYSEAAPETDQSYDVGGLLRYLLNGEVIAVPLLPSVIIVRPDPSLLVHYFWERYVVGDDPFTDEVEPSVPFTLGVAIKNAGHGTAYNLQIASGQPQIISNERGLLIDFMIIGAHVGNGSVSPSLTVIFGDLAPNTTMVARWLIISSLEGEFTDYSATFQNINPLGDPKLSVLDDLQIHELLRNVRIYSDPNEDDGVLDFLVNEQSDLLAYPDAIYSSKTLQRYNVSVGKVLTVRVSSRSDTASLIEVRTSSNTTGWVYYRYEDTQGILSGTALSVNATKIEGHSGKRIHLPPENSWITRNRVPIGDAEALHLHILDNVKTTDEVNFFMDICLVNCQEQELPFTRATVKAPTPTVTVTTTANIVYAGSAKPLILTCDVNIDPAFESFVNISITWFSGRTQLTNNSEYSSLSNSQPLVTSTLTLSSLDIEDNTTFACQARAIPLDTKFSLSESEVGEDVITIDIQPLPTLNVSIQKSNDLVSAGESLSLTCSAMMPKNIVGEPILMWNGPGVNMNSSQPRHERLSTIVFSVVHTSHAGMYTCMATLYIPEAGVNITAFESTYLTVQIPPPVLNITGSPRNTNFFRGLDQTFLCKIDLDSTIIDTPVEVTSNWKRNSTQLDSSTHITVKNVTSRVLPNTHGAHYQTSVRVNPMDYGDIGVYICTVTIRPQNNSYIVQAIASVNWTITTLSDIPPQHIDLTEHGNSTAGHSGYTLVCTVTWEQDMSSLAILSIEWLDTNGTLMNSSNSFYTTHPVGSPHENILTSRLTFNDLSISHSGQYTCRSSLNIHDIGVVNYIVNGTFLVQVKYPDISSQLQVRSLCSIIVWYIPAIPCEDIHGYSVRLFNPNSENQNVTRHVGANSTFYIIEDKDRLMFSDMIMIHVQARVIYGSGMGDWSGEVLLGCDNMPTPFVPTQPPVMPNVYFELDGRTLQNNSAVNLTDIGENERALLCRTNKVDCCKILPNRFGEFYYPNDELVPIFARRRDFYRNRSNQLIRLNRENDVTSPKGKFRCEIPDADNVMQKIYITIV